MGPLCPCTKLKKAYEKGLNTLDLSWPSHPRFNDNFAPSELQTHKQGRTDNSWGPQAIGDHGAPVSLPKLKRAYEKGTRGISWGPLLTPGPRAVPKFPNGQSAP
ncbi:unnamed protein product, partial [Staurois parvus]